MKIGIIPDLHLKLNLGYSELIDDKRTSEKKSVLDYIIKSTKDCDKIVLLGDQLDSRNSSPHVIKELINLLEQFGTKELFIIAGNHEKFGDGRSAIDFLKEIKGHNWNIITNEIFEKDDMVFCPYFTKSELGAKDNDEAKKMIMKKLKPAKFLFVHHGISATMTNAKFSVDFFPEPILPKASLEKKYDLIFGGHIHSAQESGKVVVVGSVFTNEINEKDKRICILDTDTLKVESLILPGRSLYKLENPSEADLSKIKKDSILKVILTKKISDEKIEELKKKLDVFDAYMLIERLPREKKKFHYDKDKNVLELGIEELLGVYAKEKGVSLQSLLLGYELIK